MVRIGGWIIVDFGDGYMCKWEMMIDDCIICIIEVGSGHPV